MSDEEFERLIQLALDELPSEFSEKLENVEVTFETFPSRAQMSAVGIRSGGFLLGLYQGVPQTRRGRYGVGGQLPDKITIFKYPILMISRSYNEAVEKIKDTVMHEIAHHFGLSDDEIHKAQDHKRKTSRN